MEHTEGGKLTEGAPLLCREGEVVILAGVRLPGSVAAFGHPHSCKQTPPPYSISKPIKLWFAKVDFARITLRSVICALPGVSGCSHLSRRRSHNTPCDLKQLRCHVAHPLPPIYTVMTKSCPSIIGVTSSMDHASSLGLDGLPSSFLSSAQLNIVSFL